MNETSDPGRHTFRRFEEGESVWRESDLTKKIFQADHSYKCPTYVQRTPPCQASCPSGHDVRGWLAIARGMDKPPLPGTAWQQYAFERMVSANPFPAIMGRVCPAPCEHACNRNEVDEFVGINSLEHYVGDWAIENGLKLPRPGTPTGKKIAVVGGGPAGLACAYFLRRKGHAVSVFEARAQLGGMMRYGIPAYRTPRHVLDAEVERILELGVSVFTGTKIGVDVSLANLEREFDAVFIGLGAQNGVPLPVPGADKAPNCISGIAFLNAFNDGRLRHVAARVVVVGGGDTAMDVAAVARRLGHIGKAPERDRPEYVVLGQTEHDVAMVAKREGADVMVAYRRPIEKMPAARQEIEHVLQEGVQIRGSLAPVEVVLGSDGRAKALRVVEVDWVSGKMQPRSGSEFDIECDLIVAAVGQTGDFTGMEELDNGSGLINVGERYRWPGRPGIFVGGDVVRPHLLTSAIGHARIAAASIDHFVLEQPADKRPKIDVVQFNLLRELNQRGLEPGEYDHQQVRGTAESDFAVHNYDDRSSIQIVTHDELFKGHFPYATRQKRMERQISADAVLGDLTERARCLTEEQAVAEAQRCMSCGLCFECDNCLIYCPQAAVLRFPKKERAVGHYVYTDYAKCIGCHICRDVCPAGYIQMGMGE